MEVVKTQRSSCTLDTRPILHTTGARSRFQVYLTGTTKAALPPWVYGLVTHHMRIIDQVPPIVPFQINKRIRNMSPVFTAEARTKAALQMSGYLLSLRKIWPKQGGGVPGILTAPSSLVSPRRRPRVSWTTSCDSIAWYSTHQQRNMCVKFHKGETKISARGT